MKKRSVYAAVIGGGAAGMMCALRAAERHPDRPVVIVERADRVGKKLLVTGNGRCNLSNINASPAAYHGEGSDGFINILFSKYSPNSVITCFNELGLLTHTDPEGRVYPRTNLASSVLDVLRMHLGRRGVEELCGRTVTDIRRSPNGYAVVTQNETILAEKLVIAVGGLADYAGRTGESAGLLQLLGLPTTPLTPSLSPVRVKGDALRPLKGVRADAAVSLMRGSEALKTERGEVQFTENALSGICVFNLSREANRGGCELRLNLLPDLGNEAILAQLTARLRLDPDAPVTDLFVGMFHKNIGLFLLKSAGISPSSSCKDIFDKELKNLCRQITDRRFTCEPNADFRKAQVTAGGVRLDTVDPHTFEVRRHRGMYIIGEALDIDGDCGGYNLQFAWASGMCAGDIL